MNQEMNQEHDALLQADEDQRIVYLRASGGQYARWKARAAAIDRPLSWWVRAVLDWAADEGIGDPRQLPLYPTMGASAPKAPSKPVQVRKPARAKKPSKRRGRK